MSQHAVPLKIYYRVFLALMAFTVLTVAASFLPVSEPWHTLIGLIIAGAKALLVILFFMHVLYEGRLTWLFLLGSLFWLGILFALTLSDYLTRGMGTYPIF